MYQTLPALSLSFPLWKSPLPCSLAPGLPPLGENVPTRLQKARQWVRKCPGVYFKKLLPQGLLGTEQLVAFVCQGSTYPLLPALWQGKGGGEGSDEEETCPSSQEASEA